MWEEGVEKHWQPESQIREHIIDADAGATSVEWCVSFDAEEPFAQAEAICGAEQDRCDDEKPHWNGVATKSCQRETREGTQRAHDSGATTPREFPT